MIKIDEHTINSYLWFSYLPPAQLPKWIGSCVDPNSKYDYAVTSAAKQADSLFDNLLTNCTAKNHIVPLSGGWDSRLIFGSLVKRLDTSQISAVTFGVPGQLDYEIGALLAKRAGVKHYKLDLREIELTWQKIIESAKISPWNHVMDVLFHFTLHKTVPEGAVLWSGFNGEVMTGSHLPPPEITDVDEVNHFAEWQNFSRRTDLVKPGFNAITSLPPAEKVQGLLLYDVLDLGILEATCIAPILLQQPQDSWGAKINKKRFQIIAPYIDPMWAGYWLQAPVSVRRNQKLYVELLNHLFPNLMEIPGKKNFRIKNSRGLRYIAMKSLVKRAVKTVFPSIEMKSILKVKYLNENEMYRTRRDYQEVLDTAIDVLKQEKAVDWLNIENIRARHMKGEDNGIVLNLLVGLAANIAVEREESMLR